MAEAQDKNNKKRLSGPSLGNYVASIPKDQVVDLELGLYDARRPQSHSQDVRLRGHVVWRRDAGHVLEETTR